MVLIETKNYLSLRKQNSAQWNILIQHDEII